MKIRKAKKMLAKKTSESLRALRAFYYRESVRPDEQGMDWSGGEWFVDWALGKRLADSLDRYDHRMFSRFVSFVMDATNNF